MPTRVPVTVLIMAVFVVGEAAKHYWAMTALSMGGYHLLSLGLDVAIAGAAIGYVWVTAERGSRAIRLKNQELARLTEELRHTEKVKDDLTAMIVHDLRSPLTGLTGGLQMMEVLSQDSSPQRIWEYHGMASAAARRMVRLVNHLLDITRMESGEMKLQLERLSVQELLAEGVEQSRLAADSQQARVELEVAAGLPPLNGDRQLLLRVLDNLIGNALKFTDRGAAVRLSARAAPVGEGPEQVVIAVSDTGPGIPTEYHQRIFDKFGTVEARRAGVKPSTGLGLAFCRLAVEAHGGCIWVNSEEGAGSTFSVALPAWAPAEPGPTATAA
ncbi:MAG: HAMP domain-containing sensor histidine kinase [Candidatus Latescibacterota bacterium]